MKLSDYKTAVKAKLSDRAYSHEKVLRISLILRMDSYKISHPYLYKDGIYGMVSYGEARIPRTETVVPVGMQMLVKKYLSEKITMADIDDAEKFAHAHLGRPLFHRESWEKVVSDYDGYLPLTITAIPEGTPVCGGVPLYTCTVIDKLLFWMSAAYETLIQRGVWYPTTVATKSREIKEELRRYYVTSGANMDVFPFAYHDFGARGVTCPEQAEIGGMAHLVNWRGSDTIEGILSANFYYNEEMAGYSVVASEHSIEISFGKGIDDARQYLSKMLEFATEGSIVSIVIDGFDVERETILLCTEFRQQIIDSKAKVVFRPDSGDMMDVVPMILKHQETAFGHTLTKTGHKQINHVGILQGDGVCLSSISALMGKLVYGLNYSADAVFFGSGGANLQKMDRDTLKFAQKACAILVQEDSSDSDDPDLIWKGVSKDPITDSGKRSKEGVLTTIRHNITGEYSAFSLNTGVVPVGFTDAMMMVYQSGILYNETTLSEMRGRSAIN